MCVCVCIEEGVTLWGVSILSLVLLLSCSASQPALMVPASSGTSSELL